MNEMKTSTPPIKKIILWCTYSRLLLLILQYLANILIPDHNAHVFLYKSPENIEKTQLDKLIFHVFGGLVRWDAHHFMHISLYGYTFEHTLAFFPFAPILAKILGNICILFLPLKEEPAILLSSVLMNTVLFTLTAIVLYMLTIKYFNESFARKTVWLFCYNPASIFFAAPYTECSFAFLTFSGIYYASKINFEKGSLNFKCFLLSFSFFSLSLWTRSNGLLNLGFLLYYFLFNLLKSHQMNKISNGNLFKYLLLLIITTLSGLGIFILLQAVHYYHFCTNFPAYKYYSSLTEDILIQAKENQFITHQNIVNSSWCNFKYFPMPYSYVQDKYWNVGFLRYYQLKQLPNFMLAFPVIYLVLSESIGFLSKNGKFLLNSIFALAFNCFRKNKMLICKKDLDKVANSLIVYVIHAFFLCFFCIFCVHIQVTTRMLFSANPIIYWFAANKRQDIIKLYFLSYYVLGTIMFCNFLPWT